MARRRMKRKAPRRSRGISVLNTLESYAYASILSRGLMGNSPLGVISGGSDIRAPSAAYTAGGGSLTYVNADNTVSLSEIISSPDLALQAISQNAMANWQYMAGASFATGFGFRLGKKLLRRPLSNVQRNIVVPLLGKGVLRI
jgi:hypothetical protein|tara:strand:+ start:1328 stop:1756 length:429 start_codon:yes stop_codon:yes gene_type:complete